MKRKDGDEQNDVETKKGKGSVWGSSKTGDRDIGVEEDGIWRTAYFIYKSHSGSNTYAD